MAQSSEPSELESASALGIGALSRATGVPAETLRTWERRYGFPKPIERSGARHRRYSLGTVEHVRLAVRALQLGHKPSVALRVSLPTLREMVELHEDAPPGDTGAERPIEAPAELQRWWSSIRLFDGPGLLREMQQAWGQLGAMRFAIQCAGPFLRGLGDAWAAGELTVSHEHFASEHLRAFLSAQWRPLSDRARGPRIVCATPAGERHVLGLHIAALTFALVGAEILFLGADTPSGDLAITARHGADAVGLSASTFMAPATLRDYVRSLRSELGESVPIVLGGEGFRFGLEGAEWKGDLEVASDWARSLQRRSRSEPG